MKTELTAEELALVDVVRDEWINLAYKKCSEGINKPQFEESITWVYKELLSLEKPEIVYCDSIIEALIKITIVKDLGLELDSYPEYFGKYMDNTLDEEFNQLLKVNLELKNSYIGWSNFGWVCFYDYFTRIGVLDDDKFNNYRSLIQSNVFECFEFEFAVFAVQPPVKIHTLNDIPNSVDENAVQFGDGTGYPYINGLLLDDKLFTSLLNKTYTFEDFVKEPNEEIKSAVLSYQEQKNGSTGVFDFIRKNLKKVDTFVNNTHEAFLEGTTKSDTIGVYILHKGDISGTEVAFVQCYCPSSDRLFFLGVDPSQTNAKDAIASLYQVPTILKNNITGILRQGEKFTTFFDAETTQKIKDGVYEVEKFKEYSSISGDEYFKLIQYEY